MRVILKLRSKTTILQKGGYEKYYSSTNAWFYKKLNKSELHNKNGLKYFCFSNLIGINNEKVELDKIYSIIFSFAQSDTAYTFVTSLELGEIIDLGAFNFELVKVKFDKLIIQNNMILETPTIIEVQENINKNDKTKKPKIRSIDFLKEHDKFLDLLTKNILRKYNELKLNSDNKSKFNLKEGNLFDNIDIKPIEYNNKKIDKLKLKGQDRGHFAIPVLRNKQTNKLIPFYGNKLQFIIREITDEQKDILNTVVDAGFGGHNSYGMGFIIKK